MQDRINELAKALRVKVIKKLVERDFMRHNKDLTPEHLAFMVFEIDRLPIDTRRMSEAFRDAHRMHEDKGLAPHAVCVGDLEWCTIYGSGYHSPKFGWLPKTADSELCALPEYIELDKIYKREKKAIAPNYSTCADNDATRAIADNFSGRSA